LKANKIVDVQADFFYCPKAIPSLPDLNGIGISISGFDEIKRAAVLELLEDLNLIPSTDFVRKRHQYLLCHERTGKKFEKAQEWNIPVVSLGWFIHMVEHRKVYPPDPFLILARPILDETVIYISSACNVCRKLA
jgi:hypothetical protein